MASDTPMPLSEETNQKSAFQRFLPLLVIATALIAFFATGANQYFSLDALSTYRGDLTAFRDANFPLAFASLIVIYAALVAISFPGAGFLTIFAGFLFGPFIGTLGVIVGATLGATIIFKVASTSFGETLRAKAGPWLEKFEAGFKEGELSYLFILRIIPAFPFFLVNIAPAFLGVKTRNFVLSTFFGIIPGSFVYASIGNGAGAVLDQGEELQLSGVLTDPAILVPIIGLAVLALIPVAYKRFSKKSAA